MKGIETSLHLATSTRFLSAEIQNPICQIEMQLGDHIFNIRSVSFYQFQPHLFGTWGRSLGKIDADFLGQAEYAFK